MITPRVLKGFRDYLPALMIPRERMLEQARQVYRSYGFAPIDTPALEYAEILLGKGGEESDKITYRFKDHGDRDVALRFDLTVPFARFAAQYINELGMPFKRYTWGRSGAAKTPGKAGFREFWQCDFDIIGTTSNASDVEVALVINDLMHSAGVRALRGARQQPPGAQRAARRAGTGRQAVPILRILDKLPKVGRDAVLAEMAEKACVLPEQAERVLALAGLQGGNAEILDRLEKEFGGNAESREWNRSPARDDAGDGRSGGPRRSASGSTSPSAGDWIITRERSTRRSCSIFRTSAVFARAADTTTLPGSTRSSSSPAWAPRSGWIASWRRWRS